MLTGRSVIIVIVVVVVVSLVASTLSLLGPQDRDGQGHDSYGTRPLGNRAIFEILAELDIPVDRTVVPPVTSLDQPVTVVLWGPQTDLVTAEPSYLQRLSQWVRRGGRVVIAPEGWKKALEVAKRTRRSSPIKETSAPVELGLPAVVTMQVDLAKFDEPESEPAAKQNAPTSANQKLGKRMLEALELDLGSTRTVGVTADGTLASPSAQVASLRVPDKLQALTIGSTQPQGQIMVKVGDHDPLVIAASYRLDKGEVIIVSDRSLFENRLIGEDDNAVLAVRLLADADRTVLWDEFYHGLTIRGQPLYLLTRGAYALFALLCVATTAAWVWRSAIFLGPPLAAVETMRRTLAEYVSAMARFLGRGPGSRRFVLEEVRTGVLWSIRKKLGLSPAEQSPAALAVALARHDPRAAQRLLDAVAAADLTLSQPSRITDRRILQALKGLNDCL